MLQPIRRFQKSILITVAAVMAVALAWWGSEGTSQQPNVAFVAYDRQYRAAEGLGLAKTFDVALRDLGGQIPFNPSVFGQFAMDLYGGNRMDIFMGGGDRTQYALNLVILRREAARLGIVPTPGEITALLQSLPRFAGPDGQFSRTAYEDYIRTQLGRVAMTEGDLIELAADVLRYQKLQQLIGSGFKPTEWEIENEYHDTFEEITAHQVFLPRQEFDENIEISDEAVRQYYEENKEQLLSQEKRAFEYLLFELPQQAEEESAEQWEAKRNAVAREANEAYGKLVAEDNGTFEEIVKRNNWETEKTEPFPMTDPPEKFQDEPSLMRAVFEVDAINEGQVALPVQTPEGWYVYRVTEIIEPRPLELEEARERIVNVLTNREIRDRLQQAAEQAREKIREEIKSGKDFAAAAEAAGVESKSLQPFTRGQTPEDSDHASRVAELARDLPAGLFSEPDIQGDGALLVFVTNREVPERETSLEDRQRIAENLRAQRVSDAFSAWFEERREEAGARALQSLEALSRRR